MSDISEFDAALNYLKGDLSDIENVISKFISQVEFERSLKEAL